MAASYIGCTNAAYTASTSFDAQVPTNVLTGDLLICVLFKTTTGGPTVPAGWALAALDSAARIGAATSTVQFYSVSSPVGGCAVYWKLAEAADEAAPTYTWTVSSSNGSMTMLAFRDVQPQLLGGAFHSGMLFEQAKQPTRSSTTIASPALGAHNCGGDRCIVIAAIGQLTSGSTTTLSAAAGYNEVVNNVNSSISSSIGYNLVDLSSDPDVGVKQVTTDTASGNGAGWVLLIGDSSADIVQTPVQPVVGATRSELVNAMNSNLTVEQGAAATLPVYVTLDDHTTPATGLASGDFSTKELAKPGGSMTSTGFTVTEIGSGWYAVDLVAANTDTIGLNVVHLEADGCDPAYASFQVETARAKEAQLPAALVGGRVDATVGAMQNDVVTAAAVAANAIEADALASDARAAIAAAVMSYAHEAGRTVLGVLRRLDALMTGKATGLIGATVAFFRPDGTTKAIEATQDVAAGTRETASTVGGD